MNKIMVQQQYVNETSSSRVIEQEVNHLCGQKYWHMPDCRACEIIAGRSRRKKGLRQNEVAALFDNRMFGYSSSTGHYESVANDDGTASISHYWTTEAIITKFNKQIENSQCWSAGFAKCSSHKEDYTLPLSTLEGIVGDQGLYKIEVLDYDSEHWTRTAVIRVEDRYFLVDSDENQRFIAELITPANTIQEAYDTMKPRSVLESEKQGLEVKRQGEWFLIPTQLKDSDVSFKTSAMFETVPKYIETDREGSILHYEEIEEYGNRTFYNLNEQEQKDFRELVKIGVVTERKYTPQLEKDSNHLAQHKGLVKYDMFGFNETVVKGYLKHVNREHQKLVLDTWHIVKHNVVKQAFQVTARGSGRSD